MHFILIATSFSPAIWLMLVVTGTASAQLVREPSASAGRAGPVTEVHQMPASANPASLAGWDGLAAAVHVARPYHLPSLHAVGVHLAAGTPAVSLEAGLERFGYDAYAETKPHVLAAGRARIGDHGFIATGARLHLVHAAPIGYPSAHAWSLDAGWIASIAEGIRLGGVVQNLLSRGAPSLRPPTSMALGAAVALGGGAWVNGALRREAGNSAGAGIGLEVRPHRHVHLRAGVLSDPVQLCGGLGLQMSGLHADFAAVSHPVLGWSSSVTLVLQRNR